MKKEQLYNAITDIDDDLIEEAINMKPSKKNNQWKKILTVAACAAIIIGAVAVVPKMGNENIADNSINSSASEGKNMNLGKALAEVIFPKAYAYDDYQGILDMRKENPVDVSFTEAINNFQYRTAAEIAKNADENMNYSPISLYYALAIAASGAEGETSEELMALLGTDDKEFLAEQCGNLYRNLYIDNEAGSLKIANSLWMNKDIEFKAEFPKIAADNFYAHSFNVDFADPETAQIMSDWIKENTEGLLSPEIQVNPQTVLSILNTVYFKDEWYDSFNKDLTAKDKFTLADGSAVDVDFMNRKNDINGFVKGDNFTRSSLELKNRSKMIFILPDEGVSPQELMTSPESIKNIFEGGENQVGNLTWKIPKFDFSTKMELNDTLKALGVESAFSDADFSGITDANASISDVKQETNISIDENGVEAAAYTAIMMAKGMRPSDINVDMVLDRPFIFGIQDLDGSLLFVGICENPVA